MRRKEKRKFVIIGILVSLLLVVGLFIFKEDKVEYVPESLMIGEASQDYHKGSYQTIEVNYPKFKERKLNKIINDFVVDTKDDFKVRANEVKKEAKKDKLKANLKVDFNTYTYQDKFISVELISEESIPFNEVIKTSTYLVFDTNTNELVELDDVFVNDYTFILEQLIVEELYAIDNSKNRTTLFNEVDMDSINNFMLSDNSLELIVNNQNISIDLGQLDKFLVGNEHSFKPNIKERKIDPDKKMIALTFDDGPHYQFTNEILDVLEAYDAAGTFYVLGSRVTPDAYPTLQRMVNGGSEIGNHSFSHPSYPSLSLEEINQELSSTNENVYKATSIYPRTIRPPYGALSNDLINNTNSPFIMWSIDTLDWKFRDGPKTANYVTSIVEDGDIVLLHDIYQATADATRLIIEQLSKEGYQFVTVSELLEYRYDGMIAGEVYN